ncbi:MAG: hypothetical protein ATN35_13030 [Epulopiscium sp. Nele67-Bin004]|nr:MAG: hypothetical protein ATN35_13030 [Epulopiscium sp. Nele67-Bin004]
MKKLALLVGSLVLLTGCSSGDAGGTSSSATNDTPANNTASETPANNDTTPASSKLVVGASPAPHAEILEFVKPVLAESGIELIIEEFTDYVLPNLAVEDGDLDANFFQHVPYLTNFNENNQTDIVSVGMVHFEPLGIYAGKSTSIADLQKGGAEIAIPNDTTNEARALALLESLGIIVLDPEVGLEATPNDIIDNPYNITFVEIEAAQVPRIIQEVDFGIANGNYALDGGIADLILATEDKNSEFAILYANIVATHSSNKDNAAIQYLVDALQSDDVADFINDNYNGIVLPMGN